MFMNMLTVARCQGHNVVGTKGVRSNSVFSTLSFLPFAHPRRFFNVTSFGNFMPKLILCSFITGVFDPSFWLFSKIFD